MKKKIFFLILVMSIVVFSNSISLADNTQTQETIFPGLTGQELIDNLRNEYKPANVLSYDNARDTMYAIIDNHNDSVACVYSGYQIYLDPTEDPSSDAYSKDINAEHTWPQSKGADHGNAHSDLHHLFPTRVQVNSSRGNAPFDEINDVETDKWWRNDFSMITIPTSYIDEYSEKDNDADLFEPREDQKGNAARAIFYIYAMYKSQLDTNFFNIQKDVLKQWNYQDEVNTKELERNDKVAQYQDGKENPFILDTTLVRRAYFPGESSGIENPSDFTATSVSTSQIDLSWTKNSNNDDVMIVWNTSGNFDDPPDSTTYSHEQTALGGTVIGRRSATNYSHTPLDQGTTYYYKAFSVHGEAGFELYSYGTTANATATGGTVQPGDVIITEIMQNPDAVYDSDGEWFEIYNRTDQAIDINGWFIKDNDTDSHQINNGGSLIIQPESYMVLSRNANINTNGGVQVDYEYSGINIANGDDEIVLYLADNITEIDRVEYDGGLLWPDPTGASMYFNGAPTDNNNDPSFWLISDLPWEGSAGDIGTPGYENIVSPIVSDNELTKLDYRLKNYPNPFNPSTTISYTLPVSQNLTIKIYDITGKEIKIIVNKYQTAGNKTAVWDSKDNSGNMVSSGIYFIYLQAGNLAITKKITLLK